MGLLKNKAVVGALALITAAAMVTGAAGALTLRVLVIAALVGGALWGLKTLLGKATAGRLPMPNLRGTSLRPISLLPPPERYRHRPPTSQEALHQALLNAGLGSVVSKDRTLVVNGGRDGVYAAGRAAAPAS